MNDWSPQRFFPRVSSRVYDFVCSIGNVDLFYVNGEARYAAWVSNAKGYPVGRNIGKYVGKQLADMLYMAAILDGREGENGPMKPHWALPDLGRMIEKRLSFVTTLGEGDACVDIYFDTGPTGLEFLLAGRNCSMWTHRYSEEFEGVVPKHLIDAAVMLMRLW